MAPHRFVYVIRSRSDPAQYYTGLTGNVPERIASHNSGRSAHTARYRPWSLVVSVEFADPDRAAAFERYLKSGSGTTFSFRHFR